MTIYACARRFDTAISDGMMRLQDFPAAGALLGELSDSYHWKGMDKEAVAMLAREMAAYGDLALSVAIRRAFETGGYPAVVRCQLAALEKRALNGSFYLRFCRPARPAQRAGSNSCLVREWGE